MYRPEVQLAAATFGKSLRRLSAGVLRRTTCQMQSEVQRALAKKPPLGKIPSRLIVAHLVQRGRD
jgi:hypothetical protein